MPNIAKKNKIDYSSFKNKSFFFLIKLVQTARNFNKKKIHIQIKIDCLHSVSSKVSGIGSSGHDVGRGYSGDSEYSGDSN